ncbi:hypothetical protein [Streptomyces sp. NRRL WC-3744]|uniref:hypothetical protein n=1 Tax=Streptomyces sp. NRRL WC-3744 TaxID=1463935 RepID=UPI00055A9836|nr:hypothetical protein [Streptomyces sp. NRRL WC-3744]
MLIATNARGYELKRPTKPAVGTMLANLRRGNEYLILERRDEEREGDWYIQVWFRDNNTYQLEYRDGVPAEHHQTRTVCLRGHDHSHQAAPAQSRSTDLDMKSATPSCTYKSS